MAKVIIHIGMHKTGSSSIQASLYSMHNGLNLKNHQYLDMGVANSTGALLDAFSDPNARLEQLINRGAQFTINDVLERKKKALELFKEQVKSIAGSDLIISAEGLTYLGKDQLIEMQKILGNIYDEFRVIAYVRPPKSFISSIFQQRLKGNFKKANFNTLLPRYQERFEKFEFVFGLHSVDYWLFNVSELHQKCVVTDFCTRIGVPVDPSDIIRVNEGLSLNAVTLLYLYRLYGPGFGDSKRALMENYRLVEKLTNLHGGKLHFSDVLLESTLIKGKDDFDWMENRLGAGLLYEPVALKGRQINTISDLESPSDEALKWLSDEINKDISTLTTKKQIAEGVQKIRETTEKAFRAYRYNQCKTRTKLRVPLTEINVDNNNVEIFDIKNIIEKVFENNHEFSTISKEMSVYVLGEALKKILTQLNNMNEGSLRVAGLGIFKIKHTAMKFGESKGLKVKKILFESRAMK